MVKWASDFQSGLFHYFSNIWINYDNLDLQNEHTQKRANDLLNKCRFWILVVVPVFIFAKIPENSSFGAQFGILFQLQIKLDQTGRETA